MFATHLISTKSRGVAAFAGFPLCADREPPQADVLANFLQALWSNQDDGEFGCVTVMGFAGLGVSAEKVRGSGRGRTLKPRETLLMFTRLRIRRWLLAAVLGCGLTVGVGAGQAAADTFTFTDAPQFYTVPSGVHAL